MLRRALLRVAAFVAVPLALAGCGARTALDTTSGTGGSGTGTTTSSTASGSACLPEVVAEDPGGAYSLALDGDTVVWGSFDGRVHRRLDVDTSILANAGSPVVALAVDDTRLWYADGPVVISIPKNGGQPNSSFLGGTPIAIVPVSGSRFVLDYGEGIAAGRVFRLGDESKPPDIITGLDAPTGIAVDGEYVYVTTGGYLSNGSLVSGALLRAPRAGGSVDVLAKDLHQPTGLVLDGDRAYFLERVDAEGALHGGVRFIPKSGGPVQSVASTDGVMPVDLAVDGQLAWITTLVTGAGTTHAELVKIALSDSSRSTVAATDGVVYGLVRLHPDYVYWTVAWDASKPPADPASVRRVCR